MATTKKTTSTAVAVKKNTSTAVVNIQEMLRKQAEANAARVEPGSGKSIRIGQDKSFTLPDGTKTRESLQLVVVDFVSRNEYYEGAYNKDDITPRTASPSTRNPSSWCPATTAPTSSATTAPLAR